MRTIVHLSDLHFGRIGPDLPPALLRAVAQADPDLVVVSGDLTQRAREKEFVAAAQFLDELPKPLLAVPGNHDVPLYNVLKRWLSPLGQYRRHITDDLAPFHEDDEIAVLGINTARSLTWKNGRINEAQIEAALERLGRCGPDVTRIVVTHHPFAQAELAPGEAARDPVLGRADMAMAGFLQAGVDLILSGHEHISGVGLTTTRYRLPGRTALLVQAGTATSTRKRGEGNAFNVLRVARSEVAIECMVWQPDAKRFAAIGTERYVDAEDGWSRLESA